MMTTLMAFAVGMVGGWGVTRFAVWQGWYLKNQATIKADVSVVSKDAAAAVTAAQAVAKKV